MIKLVFKLGSELVIVRIEENDVSFSDYNTNYQQFVPIESLKLSISGILKQFPDLNGMPDKDIRAEAVFRFKQHIRGLDGEEKIKQYITNEFKKMGYILQSINRNGFRPLKVN